MAEAHVRSEGAIAEVVDLLTEMRQARGVARRGQFAVLATRAIAALTPEQRRQLAVDVASRAAPQLVERIESESSLDLSPAQVRALVEMVGNLDGDDVESLKVAIQDPEFQRQAAKRALGAADEAMVDAGVDLRGDPPGSDLPPPPPDAPEAADQVPPPPDIVATEGDDAEDEWFQDEDGNWYRYEDMEDEAEDLPAEGAPRPIAAVEPPDGPREPPQPQVVPESFAEYTPGLPEMADWRAHGAADALFAFAPRDRRTDPVAPVAPVAPESEESQLERSWFGGASLDVAPVEVVRTPLGDRLRRVERSSAQLRALLDASDEFLELSPGEQASVLRQLRASWIRRRAVVALIGQGRIGKGSATHIVGAFDSPVDRSWIVASLVEAGVGTVADWADLLTPPAAARLERRYAA